MASDNLLRARLDLSTSRGGTRRRDALTRIEKALALSFARKNRQGQVIERSDLFGTTIKISGAGSCAAGRSRLLSRLMAALPYLKHDFNLAQVLGARRLVSCGKTNCTSFFSVKFVGIRCYLCQVAI